MQAGFSKLITSYVQCGSLTVSAIVDTGAAISVMSPELLKDTNFKLEGSKSPHRVMAKGSYASPYDRLLFPLRIERSSKKRGDCIDNGPDTFVARQRFFETIWTSPN